MQAGLPSLLKPWQAIDPWIGALLDPGRLVWMNEGRPVASEALRAAVHHDQAKYRTPAPGMLASTPLLKSGTHIDIATRSSSHIILGAGHGEEWWRPVCYRFRFGGNEGQPSIEHEDVLLGSHEGLARLVHLLRDVLPCEATGFRRAAWPS